jgi:hypothetical protein
MVALLVMVLLMPVAVSADTLDEDALRQLLAPAEASHARRNARAKVSGGVTVPAKPSSDVVEPLPQTAEDSGSQDAPASITESAEGTGGAESTAAGRPHVTKYRTRSNPADVPAPGPGTPTVRPQPRRTDPDIYIPPPRLDTASTTQSQVFAQETRRFGITLGTWFRANLERRITNADNGQVEVTLAEDVPGNTRMLPAGTVLFGQKSYNQVSQRLDISLSQGITPAGEEFSVVASVYDHTKVSGLAGSVQRQRDAEVRSAAAKGALKTAQALLSTTLETTGAGAIADGVGQVGDELLDNERRFIHEPAVLIQVSPQPVLVRVNQTF